MKDQSAAAEADAVFDPGERTNVEPRLALLGEAVCGASLATLESEARRAGPSGAEIDAAGDDQADVERKRRACPRLRLPSGFLDRIAQGGPCRRGGAR